MTQARPIRSLALQGTSNFRDFGGYDAHGGGYVRWRTLFRSDHLATLTAPDVQRLRALGIGRTVDFRGVQEGAAASYDWPGTVRHALPIEPVVVQDLRALLHAGEVISVARVEALMRATYAAFVRDCTAQYAAMFQLLLQDAAPVVLHCTAGKDRTGYAAALILLALGVPHATVMQDYLLTNELYRMPPAESRLRGVLPDDVLQVLWHVQADFLQTALDLIESDYGGLDAYLEQELGVGPRQRDELVDRYVVRA